MALHKEKKEEVEKKNNWMTQSLKVELIISSADHNVMVDSTCNVSIMAIFICFPRLLGDEIDNILIPLDRWMNKTSWKDNGLVRTTL